MGLFNFFNLPDINKGVEDFNSTPNAVLLDVRTEEEYSEGHIPKSMNVPLHKINNISGYIKNKNTPIFVHCLSGARSAQAAAALGRMGYTDVRNIGGISSYRGKVAV